MSFLLELQFKIPVCTVYIHTTCTYFAVNVNNGIVGLFGAEKETLIVK